jgi:predicted nucleic acid-binding protein
MEVQSRRALRARLSMRFSVDTNVLVYAAVRQSGPKHLMAIDVMRRASGRDCVVTLQALGELFRALTGKFKVPAGEAIARVDEWRSAIPVVAADESCLIDAMDAVAGHGWSFWDAMMWATARRAGCRLLLSEDGDDGRTLGGVTLVNPFASPRSPLLTQALGAVPARSRRPRGGAR